MFGPGMRMSGFEQEFGPTQPPSLSWPSLDIDAYFPGLVERDSGTRLFAAATRTSGSQAIEGKRRRRQKPTAPASGCPHSTRPSVTEVVVVMEVSVG
jgi:hypothetical protein